jgi:hypothetical protein
VDILRAGAGWLHEQRAAYMAGELAYARKSGGTFTIDDGTIAATQTDQLLEADYQLTATVRDYIFSAANLETAGEFNQPRVGDTITEAATGSVWEVAELGYDRCWRYSDEFSNAIRVHTKLVSVGSNGGH